MRRGAIQRVDRWLMGSGASGWTNQHGRFLDVRDLHAVIELAERAEALERTVAHVLKYDAIASGVPALDTSWIHQDGVDRLRAALRPRGKTKKAATP